MNRAEILLLICIEEASELQKRISKAIRFGLNDIETGQLFTNEERIGYEYLDLKAMIEYLEDEKLITLPDIDTEIEMTDAKIKKVEKYMNKEN